MARKVRTHEAREAVLRRLAAAYDAFAEKEQFLTGIGRYEEATIMHGYACIVLRAYQNECDDPKPDGLP